MQKCQYIKIHSYHKFSNFRVYKWLNRLQFIQKPLHLEFTDQMNMSLCTYTEQFLGPYVQLV